MTPFTFRTVGLASKTRSVYTRSSVSRHFIFDLSSTRDLPPAMQIVRRIHRISALGSPTICPAVSSSQISFINNKSTSRFFSLTQLSSRPYRNTSHQKPQTINRSFCTTTKMSGEFSNADTGNKPADPYKEKNLEDPGTKEKIDDLITFVEKCKFCMMTTRIEPQGLLVSRCMALAGKVRLSA